MSSTLALYQRYTKWPFGKHLISAAVGMRAPYFSTIRPLILELAPSLCRVQIKDRCSVRNHFGTIHAGAMCTLTALCSFEPSILAPGDVPVHLQIMDTSGESVLDATIIFYISEKKTVAKS